MRSTMLTAAAGLALAFAPLAFAPAALAQPGVQETARQAERPATGEAATLQGYVLMLQEAQLRLRTAQEQTAQEPATYPGDQPAMSPARQELMREVRHVYQVMQNAPPEITETEDYEEALREVRHALDEAGPAWDREKGGGQAAAERAHAALDRLRASLANAASAAGGAVPAPPVGSGGR